MMKVIIQIYLINTTYYYNYNLFLFLTILQQKQLDDTDVSNNYLLIRSY